jgi:hypothetical protein
MGLKALSSFHQPAQVPARITLRAEELLTHIIVYSDYDLRTLIEVPYQLRTDQSAGSRDEDFHETPPKTKVLASTACQKLRLDLIMIRLAYFHPLSLSWYQFPSESGVSKNQCLRSLAAR